MPAVAPFARKTRGRRAYSVFDQNRGDALLSYHPCDRSVKATFRRPEGRPAAPPAHDIRPRLGVDSVGDADTTGCRHWNGPGAADAATVTCRPRDHGRPHR